MKLQKKTPLMLGIALYTRGFGFALVHDAKLVNWGVTKASPGDDINPWSIKRLKALVSQWKPDVIVFEDALAEDSRRGLRIRRLTKQMTIVGLKQGIKVKLASRIKLAEMTTGSRNGTKYEIAETILKRFPHELTSWLPPKRKAWMRENPRLRVFDAVALAEYANSKSENRICKRITK
jgi:hypothetical protein